MLFRSHNLLIFPKSVGYTSYNVIENFITEAMFMLFTESILDNLSKSRASLTKL